MPSMWFYNMPNYWKIMIIIITHQILSNKKASTPLSSIVKYKQFCLTVLLTTFWHLSSEPKLSWQYSMNTCRNSLALLVSHFLVLNTKQLRFTVSNIFAVILKWKSCIECLPVNQKHAESKNNTKNKIC